MLTSSGLAHDQANQIIHGGKYNERFEHAIGRLALEPVQAHSRFQVAEIRFNASSREK